MADENEFESFLQSINLAGDYLKIFEVTGFNDIDLLKSLESEEQQHMFDLVGLSAKPGHLLKFKKGLASYVLNRDCTTSTAAKEINNRTETPVPQIKVQKTLSVVGGKLVADNNAEVKEKEPWEKFIIPNVKSKRLIYGNQLTKEIYLSAYTSKQSGFEAYLNGQRRFRWGIKTNIERLEQVMSSYRNGLIPKENLNCSRYREIPQDVKIEDVGKSQRVLDHIKSTSIKINEEKSKLLNRKKELFCDNLEVKNWAINEVAFIQDMAAKTEQLMMECEQLAHDIQHVNNQLRKRFDCVAVKDTEEKRKAKRAKEQRSKAKKKRTIVENSKVGCPSNMSDMSSSDDDVPIDILDY